MSRWIDATVSLPDDGRTVLIVCPQNSEPVWIGYHDEGRWLAVDGMEVDVVTHWQDLPDPPEAEVTKAEVTIAELLFEISRMQQEVIRRTCGDPRRGIGLTIGEKQP